MKQAIAMHGWSGDGRAWGPWQRHFQRHGWQWQSGERGYGARPPTQPTWLPDPDAPDRQRRVVIGHSLGPHLMAPTVLAKATDVVLLASFSRFVPEGRAGRSLQTALKGMGDCIGTADEATMLKTFLQRAADPAHASCLPSNPVSDGLSAGGRQRLQADLDLLRSTTGLPDGMPADSMVLVVNAEADAIVVPPSQQQLLEDLAVHLQHPATRWSMPGSGHALMVPDLLVRVQQWLDQQCSNQQDADRAGDQLP